MTIAKKQWSATPAPAPLRLLARSVGAAAGHSIGEGNWSYAPGARVSVFVDQEEVAGVVDNDSWTLGTQSGQEADQLSYIWSSAQGTGALTPLPNGAGDGNGQEFTLPTQIGATITVSVTVTDRATLDPATEDGSRSDGPQTFTLTLISQEQGGAGGGPGGGVGGGEGGGDGGAGGGDGGDGGDMGGGDPPAPQAIALTATAQDATTIQLSWSGAAGTLYSSTEQDFTANANTRIARGEAENDAAVTSYTHSNLTPSTTYYYILVPNGNPNLTQGNASATTPAPPVPTWSPSDKPIGWHPALDENEQPITPYQWSEDGRMTAPVDQRVEDAPTEKVVQPGERVTLSVEEAQDWDTRTLPDGTHSIARDTALTYTWSAQGQGHFLVTQEDGTQTQEQEATGTSATWVAPDDVTEDTDVEVKCIIEDSTEELVVAPEAGSRDDEATVRTVRVKVTIPEVEFSGEELVNDSLRACAGGVDDHAATDPNPNWVERNDFQYRAHTRKVDLTVKLGGVPLATSLTLKFENNQGHDYGDGRPRKTARLHKEGGALNQATQTWTDWTETLNVTSNAQGKVSVWVLSSDVICSPTLKAVKRWNPDPAQKPVELGEMECDFAASISLRGFTPSNAAGEPLVDPDEEDTGWLFDFLHLVDANNNTGMTPAKVYLKFQNGDQRQFVNGHKVRISIHSVEVMDENGSTTTVQGTPQDLKRYAYVVSNKGGATSPDEVTATRTTTAKGETAPQVYVFGGPDLDDVTRIYVQVKDLTEHSE